MITIDVQGDTQILARLESIPGRLHAELNKRLTGLAITMTAAIKSKLSGSVLKVRTGNLRDSIDYAVEGSPTSVTATVFSSKNVRYGAIHEYGGTTRPHVIEPRNGSVLAFQMGGKTVFARRINHPGSRIPARPFMRPTLAEFRARIVASMELAAAESLK